MASYKNISIRTDNSNPSKQLSKPVTIAIVKTQYGPARFSVSSEERPTVLQVIRFSPGKSQHEQFSVDSHASGSGSQSIQIVIVNSNVAVGSFLRGRQSGLKMMENEVARPLNIAELPENVSLRLYTNDNGIFVEKTNGKVKPRLGRLTPPPPPPPLPLDIPSPVFLGALKTPTAGIVSPVPTFPLRIPFPTFDSFKYTSQSYNQYSAVSPGNEILSPIFLSPLRTPVESPF